MSDCLLLSVFYVRLRDRACVDNVSSNERVFMWITTDLRKHYVPVRLPRIARAVTGSSGLSTRPNLSTYHRRKAMHENHVMHNPHPNQT